YAFGDGVVGGPHRHHVIAGDRLFGWGDFYIDLAGGVGRDLGNVPRLERDGPAGGRRGGKLQIGRGSSSGVDEGEGEARLSAGHRLARQALLRADDGDPRFPRYVEAELRGSGEPFARNLEPGFIATGCDPTRW